MATGSGSASTRSRSKVSFPDTRIVLTAEPRETVEQLFYRGFELQLDSDTHQPVMIRFMDRNGKQADEPIRLAVKL